MAKTSSYAKRPNIIFRNYGPKQCEDFLDISTSTNYPERTFHVCKYGGEIQIHLRISKTFFGNITFPALLAVSNAGSFSKQGYHIIKANILYNILERLTFSKFLLYDMYNVQCP